MQRRQKPGRITLDRLFPICKYMAAVLIAVSYLNLPEMIPFFPGTQLPRAASMVWVLVLLAAAALMDLMDKRARRKDRQELADHVRNGGMNRSTLLALGVPSLFVLNCAAIVHFYYIYLNSGAAAQAAGSLSLNTVPMAVGIVLWIYGAEMHHIKFGSIWGIRTKATLAGPEQWAAAHKRAGLPVRLCGGTILIAATFFPGTAALIAAAVGCLGAFGLMFMK